ncbi:MAG TPA: cysteine--tRNA ligase, partial [Actinomycetes bacterium]|nr:cysteine--tRNA ligase [Actinomycetes bacterium]
MALQLHNTLTRRKEPFVPRDPGRVGIYLCGITVYGEPHVGNLRNVVVFDVLRRHLTASGYDVLYVRNYTDVDDKIINAAGHDPLRAFVVAEHWTRVYDEITAALGVLPPDIAPRASGHIPEMLALIAGLVGAGLAYQAGGDVYFAVGKWPEYGRLSGRDLAELQAGARVEVNPDKRDPLDFALWKAAKPGEPTWDSPWGPGRPGWHIECSAMAGRYLGRAFDIHGGGEDLIFPHHENEIAQSEGATGEPFARYWLHNAFLELKGEKMAKSVGNVVSPRELLGRHRGVVLRYALLGAHYRSPLEFSEEVLADAAASYDRLATFATNAARALSFNGAEPGPGDPAAGPADPGGWRERFQAALDDDLNVPAALAVLFDLVAEANPLMVGLERGDTGAAGELRDRFATFLDLAGRLGFTPLDDLPDP